LTEQFVIGLIGQPFGLDGFVKVRPFSGDIDNLLKLREATLRRGGKEQKLIIEECAAAPPAALLRFAGFTTPEEAKTLGGMEILADRDSASPLAAGEFYLEDLKGLVVIAHDTGEILGHITDIIEGGAGDLVEIKMPDGQLRLVPFRKEFFPEINPEKGIVTFDNRWILE